MTQTFNLVHSAWIPCILPNGQAKELNLRDTLLKSHELRAIDGESPLVTVAIHRLLLAIVHRINDGPTGRRHWRRLWNRATWDPEPINAYLDSWQHRFDLFDPLYPFYQAQDERVKFKSLNGLVHHIASGNNATLFDHHTDEQGITLTSEQAARALLAAQAFGLSGLSGLPEKFTYGTCAGGVIFLAQGKTLFETLMLNMMSYTEEGRIPLRKTDKDRPSWEMDTPFDGLHESPHGYLDYLTWQNRRIYLEPPATDGLVRQMTLAPGLRMRADIQDPMKHYRIDPKRGPIALRFSEARALWRDSAALFRLRNEESITAKGQKYRPPLVLDWLAKLTDDDILAFEQTRYLSALGLANDQAKSEFYRSDRISLHRDYLQDKRLVDDLESVLQLAEGVAKQLWGAARTLAKFIAAPEHDSQTDEKAKEPHREDLDQIMGPWGIERVYWSQLEVPFRQTLAALPNAREEAADEWKQMLWRIALGAFRTVTDNLESSPRTLKAVVKAEQKLRIGLAKVLG